MTIKLNTRWTQHIRDKGKKIEFEKTIIASTTMRERLLEILDEEEKQLDTTATSIKDFETPAWAYKQAFILGEKSRIKRLRDLLELKDRD